MKDSCVNLLYGFRKNALKQVSKKHYPKISCFIEEKWCEFALLVNFIEPRGTNFVDITLENYEPRPKTNKNVVIRNETF